MAVEYINTKNMHANPAFSQGIVVPANARILLIGGQNAVDADGSVVAHGDVGGQTAKSLENICKVLGAAGTKVENLVKLSIDVVDGQDLRAAVAAWMAFWSGRANPPTISVRKVAGLASPDFLIEIEAMAIVE